MKRVLCLVIAFMFCFSMLAFGACDNTDSKPVSDHEHVFDNKVTTEKYLKQAATCKAAAQYYYSCSCGEKGTQTFSDGLPINHDFTGEIASSEYLKVHGTCQHGAVYYKCCTMCGKKGFENDCFTVDELLDHEFTAENHDAKYLKQEATYDSPAIYYKSCKVCGEKGTATFTYGEKLKYYSDEEKLLYKPTSLTVSLYDPANYVYGITYNTQERPEKPVIQVAKGTTLSNYTEYTPRVEQYSSYDQNGDTSITYYVVKAEITLEKSTTYAYRAYDKTVGVGTEVATITTKDSSSSNFSFIHISDTQTKSNTGTYFGQILSRVTNNNDFIIHTGDVVEYSKYENFWKNMLDTNFSYLSKIPVMAISGNHETTYKNGSYETYKHFNNNMPSQLSFQLGYFYSFTYGNAKFIMLNTNSLNGNKLKDEQYNWLVNELQNNTATWTIVSMHNPMYSVGKWGSNPRDMWYGTTPYSYIATGLAEQLKGIFATYGVDLVLQGHDHTISRTYPLDANGSPRAETLQTISGVEYSVNPQGVIYIMNGPGGDQALSPTAAGYDESLYKYAEASKAKSWADININDNKLTVSVRYLNGSNIATYYTWGISKT